MSMIKHSIFLLLRRALLCASALILISACSQQTSGSAEPRAASRDVHGAVVKGPVRGASIEIFAIAFDGQPVLPAVATAQTDASGNFSVSGLPDIPLLARSRGGSFFDESDPSGQRNIQLGPQQGFETLIPAGETSATLNPFTQALVDKLRQQSARDDVPMASLIAGGRSLFSQAFGFDILTTVPANPTAPATSSTAAQLNYAMALGGYANAVNSMITRRGLDQPRFAYIRALARDIGDGAQNSQAGDQAITVADQALPETVINQEIRRFRNNNDAAYPGASPFEIDLSALAGDAAQGPVVEFDDATFSADEGARNLAVSVRIAPPSANAISLRIRALDDTATSDEDFVGIDRNVTIPANQDSAQITIAFIDDDRFEADETFRLLLSDARGATLGAAIEMDVVILNDDSAPTPPPTPTPTPSPSPTPTPTPSPTPTPTPVITPSPTPIATPTPVITPSPTPLITPTPTPATLSVTTSGLVVQNKSQARVQTINLAASDPAATSPPTYTVPSPNTSGLEFFLPEDAVNPATSFTQADIDDGRVLLIPDPVIFEKAFAESRSITLAVSSDSGATANAVLPVDIDFESDLGDYHLLEFGIGLEHHNTGTAAAPSDLGVIKTYNALIDSRLEDSDGTLLWNRADDPQFQFHAFTHSETSAPGSSVSVYGDQYGLLFSSEASPGGFLAGKEIGQGQMDFQLEFEEVLLGPLAKRELPYTIRSLPLGARGFMSSVRSAKQTYSTADGSLYAPDLQVHDQQVITRVMLKKSSTADFFPLNGDYAFAGIHLEFGVDSDGLGVRYAGTTLLETSISNNVASVTGESNTVLWRNASGAQGSPSTTPPLSCDPLNDPCEELNFAITTNGGVELSDASATPLRYGAIDENHSIIALVGHSLQSSLVSTGLKQADSKVSTTSFALSNYESSRHEFSVGVRRFSGTAGTLQSQLEGRRFRITGLEYAAAQGGSAEAIGEMRHGELVFGTGGSVQLVASAETTPAVLCPSTAAGPLPVATTVVRRDDELAALEQPSAVDEHCDAYDSNSAAHYEGLSSSAVFGDKGRVSFSLGYHTYSGFVSHDARTLVLQAAYDGLSLGNHLSGAASESAVALLIGTRESGFNLNDLPPQRDVDNSCGGSILISDSTKRLLRNGGPAEFQENVIVAPGSTVAMESCFEHLDLDFGIVTPIKQASGSYPSGTSAAWQSTIPNGLFSEPNADQTNWQAPTSNSGRSFLNAIAKNTVFQSVLSAIVAFGDDADCDGKLDTIDDDDGVGSCD